jgi:hypothetical protein
MLGFGNEEVVKDTTIHSEYVDCGSLFSFFKDIIETESIGMDTRISSFQDTLIAVLWL